MRKKALSERDICSQFIDPAIVAAGWDFALQVPEEFSFAKGWVILKGKTTRPDELLAKLHGAEQAKEELRDQLKAIYAEALMR